jgi:hypothetical protein
MLGTQKKGRLSTAPQTFLKFPCGSAILQCFAASAQAFPSPPQTHQS